MTQASDLTGGKFRIGSQIGSILGAIYYLIGVVTYFYKGISLFGSNPKAMLIVGVTILIISIIVSGIYIFLKIKNKPNKVTSRYINKWTIRSFIFLSILNLCFTCYLLGKGKNESSNTLANKKMDSIKKDSAVYWEDLINTFHHDDIHISSKKTIIDMRVIKDFDEHITDSFKVNPIRRTYSYRILRHNNRTNKIYFKFGTSGLVPDITCTSYQPFKFYPVFYRYKPGHKSLNTYCLEIDISNSPIESYFIISIEDIEWNTQTDKFKGDEPISIIYSCDTLDNTFIFPANRIISDLRLTTYPFQSKSEAQLPFERVFTNPLKWAYLNPIQGNSYKLYWKWKTI